MKIKTKKKSVAPSFPDCGVRISQTALGRFQDCRQKARLALDGWVSKRPARPLLFGNFFHNCLAMCNVFMQNNHRIPDQIEVESICNEEWEHFLDTPESADLEAANDMQYDAQVIRVLLQNYLEQYGDGDMQRNWVNVEGRIDINYKNNRLMGFLDGAYELKNGAELWVFETKTRAYEDLESLGRILHMEFQTFYYLHLVLEKTGRLPNGICYNVVFKPSIRKTKKETMLQFLNRLDSDIRTDRTRYFQRLYVSVDPEEYRKWKETTLDPLLLDYTNWMTGKAPSYKNTANCSGKYGKCPYLEVCALNSYMNVKKQDWGGRK